MKKIIVLIAAAGGTYAGDVAANRAELTKPGTHIESSATTAEVCLDVTGRVRIH